MALPPGTEELELKKRARRRLTGAIVLVLAVVVALPLLLDNRPRPVSKDIDVRIPAQDADRVVSKPISPSEPAAQISPPPPLPSPAEPGKTTKPEEKLERKTPGAQSGAAKVAPESEKSKAESEKPKSKAAAEPEKPRPKAAAEPEKPKAKAAAPETSRPKATSGPQYVVQLGVFANPANAKQLQQKLSSQGVNAYSEVVKSSDGERTRVRAGPYPTREEAEKARAKLSSAGFEGVVAAR
jgi:DedD protein